MHQPESALRTAPPAAAAALAATHPPAGAAPLAAEQALDRLRGRLMRQSLSHLLDRVRGVRQALPHLAALETALEEHGPAVLGGLSRPVLVKLCSKLAALPLPDDDPPLQDLLERLMRALESSPVVSAASTPQSQRAVHVHGLSDFMTEEKLVVAEASYTDFAAAADELATTRHDPL